MTASDPTATGGAPEPATTSGGGVNPVSLTGLTLTQAQGQGLVSDGDAVAGGVSDPASMSGRAVAVIPLTPMDRTRQRLAYILLGALLGVIVIEIGFSAFFAAACWIGGSCDAKAAPAMQIMSASMQPMFTAMIGLVGSVVGFYFGSKTQE